MSDILIRQYKKDDRAAIRDIAWETAFIGKPADDFFEGKEILADFLTQYFTDYEPSSCFVAINPDGRIIGYLIGSKNPASISGIFRFKILPRLLIQTIKTGTIFKKKNLKFILHSLISFLRQEFKIPDFSLEYPAILHINLLKDYRDLRIGSRLIAVYLDYLRQLKIPGVYLATLSDRAAEFFSKQEFVLLYKGHRSYFRYILKKDIPIYIYAKKI